MPAFCLLADPRGYRPCPNDMLRDEEFRKHWMDHFREHFVLVMKLAVEQYGAGHAVSAEACRAELMGELDAIEKKPDKWGELNLLVLDILRQKILWKHDLADPFLGMKGRENAAMLALYPKLVEELDERFGGGGGAGRLLLGGEEREFLVLMEGIMAGNIFDMGTMATAAKYSAETVDFAATRDGLEGKRPWLVDHFSFFWESMAKREPAGGRKGSGGMGEAGGYKKVIFFVDNAGSDVVLGVLPFARWLGRRGTEVVLAANSLAALNDVTVYEMRRLLQDVAAVDGVMAELVAAKRVRAVDSGGICPLIDLRHVSAALNAEAADADLVILEGMGRAVGSNLDAMMTVDSVKLAMIKDPMIAKRLGGKVFDTVLRFDAGRGEG